MLSVKTKTMVGRVRGIADTYMQEMVWMFRNKTRVFTMNLPDGTDSSFKRRGMSAVQSSFHISRIVPLMTAATAVDKAKED